MDKVKARLLSKAEWCNDCLIWTGTCSKTSGYGLFWLNGKNQSAHRVSYQVHKGEIPSGLVVMHSCDNRKCINPAHLSLGSHTDNYIDMEIKGRAKKATGTTNANSKLSTEQANEIRRRYKFHCRKNGSSALAREFGVSQGTIYAIISGKTWK